MDFEHFIDEYQNYVIESVQTPFTDLLLLNQYTKNDIKRIVGEYYVHTKRLADGYLEIIQSNLRVKMNQLVQNP